jgi:pimeloyl-ACP methyl ester carboxylesterase
VDTKKSSVNPRHAGRIEEGLFAEINDVRQWITLRGADRRNPVMFILAPLSRMAPFFAPWEQEFTLVQWDQPGIGATQAKNGDAGTGPLSLERIANDAIAVAEFVRERLSAEKIALLGISGGSLIGLKIIKHRPELFSAYVGSGQGVNWLRQEQMGYSIVLEQARLAGNQSAIKELQAIGAPPYKNVADDALKSKYCGALTSAEQEYIAGLDPRIMAAVRNPPATANWMPPGLPTGDPRVTALAVYEKLRGEIFAFDARRLGPAFEVPMFFFQGEQDLYTVTSEVQAYAAEIIAPQKLFTAIPGGGHSVFFLRDTFLALLTAHVRPIAARTA